MGASASVLAGAAGSGIKKASSGVGHAVVAVTPRCPPPRPLAPCARAGRSPMRAVCADAQCPRSHRDPHSIPPALPPTRGSAETRKLVKMYAKEGYRQVSHYTKRGLRTAATGLTIATTIARKLDIAGSRASPHAGRDAGLARRAALPQRRLLAQTQFWDVCRLIKTQGGHRCARGTAAEIADG